MTLYSDIYDRFLAKIEDYKILQMEENDINAMLKGWLYSAISKFRTCKSDLTNRNDDAECFNETLDDLEIEVLSILMVSEWLTPQLKSVLLTKQFIGGKDAKVYSQAQHLKELMDLKALNDAEASNLLNRYRLTNNKYFAAE